MLVLARRVGESVEVNNSIRLNAREVYGPWHSPRATLDIVEPGKENIRLHGMAIGEEHQLTDNCRIKIVRIVGGQVGILFDAPKEVAIWRTELLPLIN